VLLTARSAAVTAMITIAIVAAGAPPAHAQTRGAASPPNACSYLSAQDAQTALGEPVKGPESRAGGSLQGASSCEYAGSGLHKVHLNVMPLAADMASMYKAMCAAKDKDGLTGLGDVTCWYNAKHEELQVLKGTTFFSIELHRSGDPTDAIKGVARRVYAQLK
jgi:hypothetical protein